MEDNGLCAGLALLICVTTVPVCAQPGVSGSALAQNSAGQGGSSLSVGSKITLGLATSVFGYGLYRLYKRWSAPANLHEAVERGNIDAVRT